MNNFEEIKKYLTDIFYNNPQNTIVESYIAFLDYDWEDPIVSATRFEGHEHYYFRPKNQLLYTEEELFINVILKDEDFLKYAEEKCTE